jgi:hypothetical protein
MSIPDVNGLLVKTLADHGVAAADFTAQIHALKYKAALYLRPGNLFVDKSNPKGHSNCPGGAIIETKGEILKQAKEIAAKMAFVDEPAGRWQVSVDKWTRIYTFDASGNVSWLDPFNKKSGKGTWKVDPGVMTLSWIGSTTKETWSLPLRPTEQKGSCTMDGTAYVVKAVRL